MKKSAKKVFSAFLLAMLMVLLVSCDLIKDDDISFQIEIETEVVSVLSEEYGFYIYSGSKDVKLSEIKELKGVDKIKVTNVTCGASFKTKGDLNEFYAKDVRLASSGTSVALDDIYLMEGDMISAEELFVFMKPVVDKLLKDKSVPINVIGVTNLNPLGEKIIITLTVETYDYVN